MDTWLPQTLTFITPSAAWFAMSTVAWLPKSSLIVDGTKSGMGHVPEALPIDAAAVASVGQNRSTPATPPFVEVCTGGKVPWAGSGTGEKAYEGTTSRATSELVSSSADNGD